MKETLREVSPSMTVFLKIYTTLTIKCCEVQSSKGPISENSWILPQGKINSFYFLSRKNDIPNLIWYGADLRFYSQEVRNKFRKIFPEVNQWKNYFFWSLFVVSVVCAGSIKFAIWGESSFSFLNIKHYIS